MTGNTYLRDGATGRKLLAVLAETLGSVSSSTLDLHLSATLTPLSSAGTHMHAAHGKLMKTCKHKINREINK